MAIRALTPTWMSSFETNMRLVQDNAFANATQNLWYPKVTKSLTSDAGTERMAWLLSTIMIETMAEDQQKFETMVYHQHSYEHEFAKTGLKLKRSELTDSDGRGVHKAIDFTTQVSSLAAYWPQQRVADFIKSNGVTYDNLPFFHASHPLNPVNAAVGTYANTFGGAGFRIDDGVTLDVAIKNLSNVLATIASTYLAPNGKVPRRVKPTTLLYPPMMKSRVSQILNSTFVGVTNSGSTDVTPVNKGFELEAIQADEFSAALGGSDTTCYLAVSDVVAGDIGAVGYSVREEFALTYHGPMTSAELDRLQEFQWLFQGRNATVGGHPFGLIRITAA